MAKRAIRKRPTTIVPPAAGASGPAPEGTRGDLPYDVHLNLPGRDPVKLALPESRAVIQREALRWSYSLRNRERWTGRAEVLEQQRDEIADLAALCGVSVPLLQEIARCDLVEVEIPFVRESHAWELRVMPWEFLLATATRHLRGPRPLSVVRYLRTAATRGPLEPPGDWLYIETAAGRLREQFDFSTERDLFRQSARDAGRTAVERIDPAPEALEKVLASTSPARVIHFAGFDPNQGYRLLEQNVLEPVDGLLLNTGARPRRTRTTRGDDAQTLLNDLQVITPETLAGMLAEGGAPRLVAFNFNQSAARTAALCTAAGAEAAIGFQDSFDEALAELFFATFYRAWRLSEWNTVAAFQHAWTLVLNQKRDLQGSGLVLWSGRSIRDTLPQYWSGDAPLNVEAINQRWTKSVAETKIELNAETAREYLEVDVKPLAALNYSLLHNNGVLFDSFKIHKLAVGLGAVRDLHVTVELCVGTDSFPYRATVELGPELLQLDLRPLVKMSLASALSRGLREAVRTSLFVEVRWRDVVIRRDTFPITLLPIDEWLDTDENRIWLPSFVLPRDPAVGRIIERAQRYLMAIADDPAMGFSGYQAIQDDGDGPEERCSGVDAQARAIWSALLYDLPLAYINPPPVFSDYSQRLRTPSDVVDGKRGTCIDLALLMASCLEYVDIYPVIFLLKDHAFPGYWRDEKYFEDFLSASNAPDGNTTATQVEAEKPQPKQLGTAQRYSWYLEKPHFRELLVEIHAGRLVPLETVSLTEHEGFQGAMERGRGNLTSRRDFQSMLNIISARWDDRIRVTPLPLIKS